MSSSSTNTRVPIEAPAGYLNVEYLQGAGNLRVCTNCLTVGENLLTCSRCKQTYYCSKECQTDDWKQQHKSQCKLLQAQKQDRYSEFGKRTVKLRQKWMKRASIIFPILVRQCLSTEEFHRQPPKYTVTVCFKFNCNYGTFMPLSAPVWKDIDQLMTSSSSFRSSFQASFADVERKKKSPTDKIHIIHVVFQGYVETMMCGINPQTIAETCRDLRLTSDTNYNHEEFLKLCQKTEIPDYQPMRRFKEICESNLSKQLNYLRDKRDEMLQVPWKRFVLNAYKMNERQNLKGTHALFVYFLFDFVPGKVKCVTRYELIPMQEARDRIPSHVRTVYLCLDEPWAVPALFIEELGRDLFSITSNFQPPPDGWQYWPPEQSQATAEYYFEKLKEYNFPLEGLEIPPSAG